MSRVRDSRPWMCHTFGCKPHKAWGLPAYGRVEGGYTDGVGREHYELLLKCDRCRQQVMVGRFHGPVYPFGKVPADRVRV